jgi:hypothetical protein
VDDRVAGWDRWGLGSDVVHVRGTAKNSDWIAIGEARHREKCVTGRGRRMPSTLMSTRSL